MYKGKRIVGLIPARGGSIGVPNKNIYPIQGQPLISYTINAAAQSRYLDALYCSTNDPAISAVVEHYPSCKIIKRPNELCLSTSKTIESVVHALDYLQQQNENYDYIMLLQPTSPLRRTTDIDGCIQYTLDRQADNCVSVSELPYLPVLMRYINDNTGTQNLEHLIPGSGTCRRQDARKTYYVDGCLYLWSVAQIMKKRNAISLNDATLGYPLSSDQLLDINTMKDIRFCEYVMGLNK